MHDKRVSELTCDDVQWVVNSIAELGVKIGDKFFWLYKGESISYNETSDGSLMWRHVRKREFGECCHPLKFASEPLPSKYEDGDGWQPLPRPSTNATATTGIDELDEVLRRISELESRVRLTQHRLAAAAQMCADIDRDPRVHTTVQACFSHVGKALESEPREDDGHV